MVDALSEFTVNGKQETTPDSTDTKEIISYINDIEELTKGVFPIHFKMIGQYQQKDPFLVAKYHKHVYKTSYFCG